MTSPASPTRSAAVIGVTGQFSAVDGLFTGEENLQLMADLRHLGKQAGRATGRRAARAVRSRRRRQEAGRDLLRRDATAPGPGHDPHRRPADHLPRRADGRTRSAQPARHVADDPGARRRWRDDLPHDAVPRGGGSTRPSDRRPRPRRAGRRGHAERAEAAGAGRPHPARRSATRPSSSGPPGPSTARRATTSRSPSRSRAMAGSARCAPCSTGSTRPRSTSARSRCRPPTSMTSSCRSPATPTNRK